MRISICEHASGGRKNATKQATRRSVSPPNLTPRQTAATGAAQSRAEQPRARSASPLTALCIGSTAVTHSSSLFFSAVMSYGAAGSSGGVPSFTPVAAIPVLVDGVRKHFNTQITKAAKWRKEQVSSRHTTMRGRQNTLWRLCKLVTWDQTSEDSVCMSLICLRIVYCCVYLLAPQLLASVDRERGCDRGRIEE